MVIFLWTVFSNRTNNFQKNKCTNAPLSEADVRETKIGRHYQFSHSKSYPRVARKDKRAKVLTGSFARAALNNKVITSYALFVVCVDLAVQVIAIYVYNFDMKNDLELSLSSTVLLGIS